VQHLLLEVAPRDDTEASIGALGVGEIVPAPEIQSVINRPRISRGKLMD